MSGGASEGVEPHDQEEGCEGEGNRDFPLFGTECFLSAHSSLVASEVPRFSRSTFVLLLKTEIHLSVITPKLFIK